ncbi:MAG: hypothetical protein HRT99_02000, partial [Mycoplasmatales bacterium]|nr:hypothetical protein [Mycoplasmatales bacterium]
MNKKNKIALISIGSLAVVSSTIATAIYFSINSNGSSEKTKDKGGGSHIGDDDKDKDKDQSGGNSESIDSFLSLIGPLLDHDESKTQTIKLDATLDLLPDELKTKIQNGNLFSLTEDDLKGSIESFQSIFSLNFDNEEIEKYIELFYKIMKNGFSTLNNQDIDNLIAFLPENMKGYVQSLKILWNKKLKDVLPEEIDKIINDLFPLLSKSLKLDQNDTKAQEVKSIINKFLYGWKNGTKEEFKKGLETLFPDIKNINIDKSVSLLGRIKFNSDTIADLLYNGKMEILEGPASVLLPDNTKFLVAVKNVNRNGILNSSEDLKIVKDYLNSIFAYVKLNKPILEEFAPNQKSDMNKIIETIDLILNKNDFVELLEYLQNNAVKDFDKYHFFEISRFLMGMFDIHGFKTEFKNVEQNEMIKFFWKLFKNPTTLNKTDLLIFEGFLFNSPSLKSIIEKINNVNEFKRDNFLLLLQKLFFEWSDNSYYKNIIVNEFNQIHLTDLTKIKRPKVESYKYDNRLNELVNEFNEIKTK